MKRTLVAAMMALAGMGLIACPARAAPAPSGEAAAIAQRIWAKLLIRCGESSYYLGSVFDGQGMAADLQVGQPEVKTEYRGLRFTQVSIPTTEAERLNGVSARVRIAAIAKVYRTHGSDTWQDGPARQPRNMDDVLSNVLQNVLGDSFDMGGGGALALELVKYKGQWFVARSSVTSTSEFSIRRGFVGVADIEAQPTRLLCRDGKLVPPPPTKEELAAQTEVKKAQAAAARQEDERQKERLAEAEQERKADAERAAAEAEAGRIIAAVSYQGSGAGFGPALRANFARLNQKFGLDPAVYQPGLDKIEAAVQRCLAVTPAQYLAAIEFAQQNGQMLHITPQQAILRNLKGCVPGTSLASPVGIDPPLTVMITIGNQPGRPGYMSGHLEVWVLFSRTASMKAKAGNPPELLQDAPYTVIKADIASQSAPSAVGR